MSASSDQASDIPSENWHASCIAFQERGLLIIGPSGSGKSSLALELLAYGCELVSDDRTDLTLENGRITAKAPEPLQGLIEARGVGILKSDFLPNVYVDVCVNMQKKEGKRLPEFHTIEICGLALPCYYKNESPTFAAALLQLLKAGRHA